LRTGITGDHLIGPCISPAKLTGPQYLRFFRKHLPQLLEDVSLRAQRIWFLHDGAPAHFSLAGREWLDRHYLARCISRGPETPLP
jgi:hypothetical protein